MMICPALFPASSSERERFWFYPLNLTPGVTDARVLAVDPICQRAHIYVRLRPDGMPGTRYRCWATCCAKAYGGSRYREPGTHFGALANERMRIGMDPVLLTDNGAATC
jgi:hypothetical protein